MSFHQLLLQFSSLAIVIKQEEESSIYDQFNLFYDVINNSGNWIWPVELTQAIEENDGHPPMFCMTVTFSHKPSVNGRHRTWCVINLDGRHTIYNQFVPSFYDDEEESRVRQCYSCEMGFPAFYPDVPIKGFFKSKESVTVIHVNMEEKITNLKLEIAECLDIMIYLCNRNFRFIEPGQPIRNVVFTKTLGLNRMSKRARVTFDGSLEYSAPQCVSVGYHGEPMSLFCMCNKK